eukprot:4923593-Amphidinium_carterae.4
MQILVFAYLIPSAALERGIASHQGVLHKKLLESACVCSFKILSKCLKCKEPHALSLEFARTQLTASIAKPMGAPLPAWVRIPQVSILLWLLTRSPSSQTRWTAFCVLKLKQTMAIDGLSVTAGAQKHIAHSTQRYFYPAVSQHYQHGAIAPRPFLM